MRREIPWNEDACAITMIDTESLLHTSRGAGRDYLPRTMQSLLITSPGDPPSVRLIRLHSIDYAVFPGHCRVDTPVARVQHPSLLRKAYPGIDPGRG